MSSTIECLVLPPEGECSENFGKAAALKFFRFFIRMFRDMSQQNYPF